jgi:GAF domain-containing protein
MATSDSGRRFDEEDLRLAEEVASRAALSAYHLIHYEKASVVLDRLEVEREVREAYLTQVRHDVLSVLTTAALSAQMILREGPERCGKLAQRIVGAIERASEILRKTKRSQG